jgi:hypothetical protein
LGITDDGMLFGEFSPGPNGAIAGFIQTAGGLESVQISAPGSVFADGSQYSWIGGVLPDGTLLGGYATEEPVTGRGSAHAFISAVENYATAALVQESGSATLTGSAADGYVLDFGTLALGSAAVAAGLGLANTATGLADTLGGHVTFSPAGGFANPADADLAGIAAGGTASLGVLGFTPDRLGLRSETFVITPQGSFAGTGWGPSRSPSEP